MNPKVTVVMPVYNGAAYVAPAIESILAQTFANFEFIIINDGSTDDSSNVIRRFKDPRIRFIEQDNKGLAATLNRGIAMARGEYIARQDQDDISLPLRFEKQLTFFSANPHCALVGTRSEIWEGEDKTNRVHNHPAADYVLKYELLFNNPFVHSSVMLRKSALDSVGVYTTDISRQPPEDYELWSRLARRFELANIPEVLHIYREFPGSMSRVSTNPFVNKVMRISAENISWYLGTDVPDRDIMDLVCLVHNILDKVSEKPDFSAIEYKLLLVVGKLTNDPDEARMLKEKIFEMVRGLTARYRHQGYIWKMLRAMKTFIRTHAKGKAKS